MSAKDKILALAREELDYREKATGNLSYLWDKYANQGSNNYNKYAYELQDTDIFNGSKFGYGIEWCTSFACWLFWKLYGAEKTHKALHIPSRSSAAGCVYFVQYLRAAGAYGSTPHVGDLIFFRDSDGDPCHIGIVESVSGSKVNTIEGNKNNRVSSCTYSIGSSQIHGYGYPDWAALETQTYTEGWVKDDNGWWYRYKDGSYPKDCWKKINAKWYCFDTEGYCLMSKWTMYNGNAYYLGSDGAMVINKTLKIDEEGKLVYAGDYYHLLSDVTSKTYREALEAAISKGFIKGEGGSGENLVLNLPEESVRMIVYLHRAGLF